MAASISFDALPTFPDGPHLMTALACMAVLAVHRVCVDGKGERENDKRHIQ